jgi:hypothetical protein
MPMVLFVGGATAFRKQTSRFLNTARVRRFFGGRERRRSHGQGKAAIAQPGGLGLLLVRRRRIKVGSEAQGVQAGVADLLTVDYSAYTEKKALSCGITAVISKLDDSETLLANARRVWNRMTRRTT